MSIPRCCRLRAGNRTPESGQALVMGLVMILVALPMGIYFGQYVTTTVRSAVADRQQKTASQYANSAVMDYFRQFSQDSYEGHYDTNSLSRPKALYSAGYSTVTFTPDAINHTLYVKASGVYGSSAAPKTTRVLEAMIQFYSDLVQYGTMVNGDFTVGATANYLGGFYTNGNLSITGSNVRFSGGPVVVRGNFNGNNAVVDGDVYCSGAVSNVTINGQRYTYTPSLTWPALSFSYYDAHYTYKTTTAQTIVFNSTGTFTVVGGATYAIPSQGAIIYGENTNLTIRGVVSGRVTVVAGSTAVGSCASATGKITVSDNLYYVTASSIAASATSTFAALARNCIVFSKSNANLTAAGIYFVEQGTNNIQLSGSSGYKFYLYGVRSQKASTSGFTPYYTYDPNLRSYQPPGLPERALLVNWNQH